MQLPRTFRIAICLLAAGLAFGLVDFAANPHLRNAAAASSVNSSPPLLKPAPSTPIAEQKAALGDEETWRPEWDATIEMALPPALLEPKMAHNVKTILPAL